MKFVSIVPMMLLAQGITAVEPEIAKNNNLCALKATKGPKKATKGPKNSTKASKGPKSAKCPKSIKSRSVDTVPLNTDTNYLPQLVNPDYWHPKSSSFQIIDWKRWEACKVPKVLNPPQRSQSNPNIPNNCQKEDEMAWWHHSKLNFPGKDAWLASPKPNYGLISDETMDIFSKILGPPTLTVAMSQRHSVTSFSGCNGMIPVRQLCPSTGGHGGHRPRKAERS